MTKGIEQLTRERDNEFRSNSRERTEKLVNYINISEQQWKQSKAGAIVALLGVSVGLGLNYAPEVSANIANYLSH